MADHWFKFDVEKFLKELEKEEKDQPVEDWETSRNNIKPSEPLDINR